MSIISSEQDAFTGGVEDLRLAFGATDYISPRLPFQFTDYYGEEMGQSLFRHFMTFQRLISVESLPDIKRTTNRYEEKWAGPAGRRRLNIDPGYVCPHHVVLATTKAYSHRPYLRKGIYADLTLLYRNKSFQPLEWTYPDYRQEETLQLFNRVRKDYMQELKGGLHPC
jgi:hypothetical protein